MKELVEERHGKSMQKVERVGDEADKDDGTKAEQTADERGAGVAGGGAGTEDSDGSTGLFRLRVHASNSVR